MLNPFIFNPDRKWEENSQPFIEERNAQRHGALVMDPAVRSRLTLRLGTLLIRMGKELTGEAAFKESFVEPWFRCNQAENRPVRFHHA